MQQQRLLSDLNFHFLRKNSGDKQEGANDRTAKSFYVEDAAPIVIIGCWIIENVQTLQ